jgi:hypothetical protein
MSVRNSCVYEHWRPDKDVCFYVGRGRKRRGRQKRKPRNPLGRRR